MRVTFGRRRRRCRAFDLYNTAAARIHAAAANDRESYRSRACTIVGKEA